jgi:hypothetical protein
MLNLSHVTRVGALLAIAVALFLFWQGFGIGTFVAAQDGTPPPIISVDNVERAEADQMRPTFSARLCA